MAGQEIRSSFKSGHISRRITVPVMVIYASLMVFASIQFSSCVFLYDNVPLILISITLGCIGGLIYNWLRLNHYRLFDRPPRIMIKDFLMATCVFSLLGTQLPAAAVYFLPGETRAYTTYYQLTTPAPALGRSGRCDAEIRFENKTINRHIQLCIDKANLPSPGEQMDALSVTEKLTGYGIKIVAIDFIRER